jgi:hypothetical protein
MPKTYSWPFPVSLTLCMECDSLEVSQAPYSRNTLWRRISIPKPLPLVLRTGVEKMFWFLGVMPVSLCLICRALGCMHSRHCETELQGSLEAQLFSHSGTMNSEEHWGSSFHPWQPCIILSFGRERRSWTHASWSKREEFRVSSCDLKSLTSNQHSKRARMQVCLLKQFSGFKSTFEWQAWFENYVQKRKIKLLCLFNKDLFKSSGTISICFCFFYYHFFL